MLLIPCLMCLLRRCVMCMLPCVVCAVTCKVADAHCEFCDRFAPALLACSVDQVEKTHSISIYCIYCEPMGLAGRSQGPRGSQTAFFPITRVLL